MFPNKILGYWSIRELPRPSVIITVPHAKCKQTNIEHRCDSLAKTFALAISKSLESMGIINALFVPTTPREKIDMNRIESRNTRFRKRIDAQLEKSKDTDILLDIHSAPADTLKQSFEIYLLDIRDIKNGHSFNQELFNFLKAKGILIIKLDGALDNDIVVHAMLDYSLENTVLIEINESMSNERINTISMVIAEFIKQIST